MTNITRFLVLRPCPSFDAPPSECDLLPGNSARDGGVSRIWRAGQAFELAGGRALLPKNAFALSYSRFALGGGWLEALRRCKMGL